MSWRETAERILDDLQGNFPEWDWSLDITPDVVFQTSGGEVRFKEAPITGSNPDRPFGIAVPLSKQDGFNVESTAYPVGGANHRTGGELDSKSDPVTDVEWMLED